MKSRMAKVKKGFSLYEGVGQIYIDKGIEFRLIKLDDMYIKIVGHDGLAFKINKFMVDRYFEEVGE